jgi:predicted nuclease of predicted toxin-antitoxin system
VRLLFDENLSPVLPAALADCYHASEHVRDLGLKSSSDSEIWEYAARNQLAIVTKDADFRQRSFLRGYPPKVICIGLGNCSTAMVELLLRHKIMEVTDFLADQVKSFLLLS